MKMYAVWRPGSLAQNILDLMMSLEALHIEYVMVTRYLFGIGKLRFENILKSADNNILSKTSQSFSSAPWVINEIRRKLYRRNKIH